MLVLSRHLSERIFIGDDVIITVVEINPGCKGHSPRVRFGITAPPDTPIHREEVRDKILAESGLARLDAPVAMPSDSAVKMAKNILATTVEHSGTFALRAVCAELLRVKGTA